MLISHLHFAKYWQNDDFCWQNDDLCGPYVVKAMNNKRSSLKKWPVIFACFNTGAISIHLVFGYRTKEFLVICKLFVSLQGRPKFVYSDRGSNLVAGARIVATKKMSNEVANYLDSIVRLVVTACSEMGIDKNELFKFNLCLIAEREVKCVQQLFKSCKIGNLTKLYARNTA